MTKKPDDKQTHKLTNEPEARAYLIEALALAMTPEEIIERLKAEFEITIATRTVWYHSQNSKGEIQELRETLNKEVKERFPFASACVRINELQKLYFRASELENQLTYSNETSEGRKMLKESIELKAKILKQVNEEVEPLKIMDTTPPKIIVYSNIPGLVNGPHKRTETKGSPSSTSAVIKRNPSTAITE